MLASQQATTFAVAEGFASRTSAWHSKLGSPKGKVALPESLSIT